MVHFKGIPLGFLTVSVILSVVNASFPYYGTKIGPLSQLHHQVSGDVYAVDSRTIFIKNFNYDGGAPAAYFYVGNSNKPGNGDGSWRVRDEKGSSSELTRRYRNKDITLSLPDGKTLRDIKWFSVWCDEFSVDFGSIKIPANLDFPRPQKISNLRGVHGVSSDDIVIVDAQTLLIPNFSYDGEAPDAKFWVGRGNTPTSQGLRIPDENGKQDPLRRYDRKTIVLTLPGDLTIFDIGHFGIWCEAFTVDFGHIRIPEGLNVPPSLKMLGISPQSKLNCEVLYDDLAFEVRWAIAGESIVVQLVAKLDTNEYMAFGISPKVEKTEMIGADAVVSWVDQSTGKGYAVDYYLSAKAQCSGKQGSCPDERIRAKTNSIRLLNAAIVNGYSIVTYQRTLRTADELDLQIFTNTTQAIVWAIGPLNERKETSYHSKYTKGDQFIDFGRQPKWNCPIPDEDKVIDDRDDEEDSEEYYDNREQAQALHQERPQTTQPTTTRRTIATPRPVARDNNAWVIPPIECWEPDDGVFYAQMGPTGGKHGYSAITGHVGWGISWFINGLLIPEIHVVRGKTYTFVTEGGNDPSIPAKYHPFYITDDPVGGYEHKTPEERKNVTIFAGVHRSRTGKLTPTGIGRLCNWTPDQNGPDVDDFSSFGEYQRTLTLVCESGEPGFISWTPDEKTPDTVYYHCFTHRYLGWKIHVHDFCESGQASEIDVVYAEPPDDIIAEPSIQREIRVRPNDNFLEKHKTNLIKNHNMNMAHSRPKEPNRSMELTDLLHEGIRAVEALEDKVSKGKSPPTEAPLIRATRPEMLKGEIAIRNRNVTKIGPPNYVRSPYGIPLFRPKLTAAIMDRRPNNRPRRPGMIAQPSIIMPHYRKPMPVRPYTPIKEPNNYLMLGQHSIEPVLKPKIKHPVKTPIPHSSDLNPQDSMVTYVAMKNRNNLKTKKPFLKLPVMHEKPNVPLVGFKKPYEIKEIKETPLIEAVNEGFKPNSVVVESGFKPILRDYLDGNLTISQEANRRNDLKKDPAEEINKAMESDTLFLSNSAQKVKQTFEPMFIPSPLDKINISTDEEDDGKRKPVAQEMVKSIENDMIKQNEREIPVIEHPDEGDEGDELEMEDEDDDEDEIALAAERVDTYYLPPYNAKRPPHRIPEGAVVTYDGKAVLDTSLITPPKIEFKDHLKDVRKGLSSIEEYVLRTPQFGPFRGEIPPLTPNFLPQDIPKNPVTEYSNPFVTTPTGSDSASSPPKTISTKLSLIKSKV